jgi:hypothetical protein
VAFSGKIVEKSFYLYFANFFRDFHTIVSFLKAEMRKVAKNYEFWPNL